MYVVPGTNLAFFAEYFLMFFSGRVSRSLGCVARREPA